MQPTQVDVPPSGFVTVMLRGPVAPEIDDVVTLIEVADLLSSRTLIPDPEKLTWLAEVKPEPMMVNDLNNPLDTEDGDAPVTFGAAFRVKQLVQTASNVPARFTTTLLLATVAVAEVLITALIRVALTKLYDVMVIPAPGKDGTDAAVKPVPLMATARPVSPCANAFGEIDVTVMPLRTWMITLGLVPTLVAASVDEALNVYVPAARPETVVLQAPAVAVAVKVLTTAPEVLLPACTFRVTVGLSPASTPVVPVTVNVVVVTAALLTGLVIRTIGATVSTVNVDVPVPMLPAVSVWVT